mmetsp:Transcript_42299/g.49235  ORF Transcript_42299/g.49235 Transcript_42299/m.49235 type:complete len:171 (-) Transcript_42299:66-578(-)
MNLFAKMLSTSEIADLKAEFEKIDVDHSGQVDADELSSALKKSGISLPDKDIDELIAKVTATGCQVINYSEFIAATLNAKAFLSESRLLMLFREFDVDDCGFITGDNIKEVVDRLQSPPSVESSPRGHSSKDIPSLFGALNDSKNEKISYEKFRAIMVGDSKTKKDDDSD